MMEFWYNNSMRRKTLVLGVAGLLLMSTSLLGTVAHAETYLQSVRAASETSKSTLSTKQADLKSQLEQLAKDVEQLKVDQSSATKDIVELTAKILKEESKKNVNHAKLGSLKQEQNLARAKQDSLAKTYDEKVKAVDALTSEKSGVDKELTGDFTIGGQLSKVNGTDAFSASIVNEAIKYYGGNIVYSQSAARGQVSFASGEANGYLDCSAFVTTVMKAVGMNVTLGSTETLFSYNGTLLQEISREEATTGDIFVVGTPGASFGNAGHAGIFLDNGTVIHCSVTYADNGGSGNIYIQDYPSNHFGLEPHFYRIVR